jgi:hypothetical protein
VTRPGRLGKAAAQDDAFFRCCGIIGRPHLRRAHMQFTNGVLCLLETKARTAPGH